MPYSIGPSFPLPTLLPNYVVVSRDWPQNEQWPFSIPIVEAIILTKYLFLTLGNKEAVIDIDGNNESGKNVFNASSCHMSVFLMIVWCREFGYRASLGATWCWREDTEKYYSSISILFTDTTSSLLGPIFSRQELPSNSFSCLGSLENWKYFLRSHPIGRTTAGVGNYPVACASSQLMMILP